MTIPNTNNGKKQEPFLRVDLVRETLDNLPMHLSRPVEEHYLFFRDHGFQGIQNGEIEICKKLGLKYTQSGRIDAQGDAERLVRNALEFGADCLTVHTGTGLESDGQADMLIEDILNTGARFNFPIYVETHRATITQDMYRTIKLIDRFPELRFNGDFSHWYTGQEMRYGMFKRMDEIFDFMAPVFERVRFLHGRIGNGGCMQLDITRPDMEINIQYFKEMWIRSFSGFLETAKQGDYIIFAPELLDSMKQYAITYFIDGVAQEDGNRIDQAIAFKKLAESCWEEAKMRCKKVN